MACKVTYPDAGAGEVMLDKFVNLGGGGGQTAHVQRHCVAVTKPGTVITCGQHRVCKKGMCFIQLLVYLYSSY